MKIKIDEDLCQGHGVCEGEAEEVFEVNDDFKVRVLQETPPAQLHDKVRAAAKYCPTRAIQIIESI